VTATQPIQLPQGYFVDWEKMQAVFWRWLPRVLLIIVGLHWAIGVWPFTPVEGDDQGVVNTLEAWSSTPRLLPRVAYPYAIQPGTYLVLRGLNGLSSLGWLQLYAAMSAAGAVWFVVASTFILVPLTRLRPTWVALSLLTAQELGAAAYYANTSAIAGAVVLSGLLIGMRRPSPAGGVIAGAVIAFGAWLRLDALLPTLAFLPLLVASHVLWRRAFVCTAFAAVVALLLLVALLAVSGLTPCDSWMVYQTRTAGTDWSPLLTRGWLALSSTMGLGSAAGLILWLVRRQWALLVVTILGSLPSIAVYGRSLTTPKYLYYAIPFLALPALWTIAAIASARHGVIRCVKFAWLAVLALEVFTGLRTSNERFRRFDPGEFWLQVVSRPWRGKTLQWGLGDGEVIPTDDGPRLRGGLWYAPAMWHREKSAAQAELILLDKQLNDPRTKRVIVSTYLSQQVVEGWLQRHAFVLLSHTVADADCRRSWWRRGSRDLTVVLVNQSPNERTLFADASRDPQGLLFVNDRGKIGRIALGASLADWQLLSRRENGCLACYRHW
jgi:hypothetical protein